MFEALLIGSLAEASPLAEAQAPRQPSLELLEFLGEFGDDEEGLFEEPKEPASKAAAPEPPAEPASPKPAPPAKAAP